LEVRRTQRNQTDCHNASFSPCLRPGIRARGVKMEKTLRIVRSKQEIQDRISELAEDICASAPNGELTIVGILDDAFVFLADLVRALDIELNCCFMKVTRHRHGGQSEVMFTSEHDFALAAVTVSSYLHEAAIEL